MYKSKFSIDKLTFYYTFKEKHADVFIGGIPSASISGMLTREDIEQICNGLQRIKEQM